MESLRHHWGFLDGTLDPGSAFVATYEPALVLLSIVVASLAAYAALGLAERIGAADKPLARRSWLAAGAVTMGVGVWAMHFLGMLAFRVPVRVSYDVWVTLASVVPAVLASGIMLYVISQARISPGRLVLGGGLMGAGIGVMHYTGTVDCVANAFRALECLRTAHRDGRPYDLAIVDHQMPDLDGMALARAIKSDPALAALPLVLLTSVSYRGCTSDAQPSGFTAFLLKPIRQSQLYDCIATVMGMASEPTPQRLITHHTLGETPSRGRVLVAEDNVVNQRLAARMLEKLGCRVDVVANGLEAVEAATRISYHAVFMDCQMPEMDGYEATTAIRQREASTGAHVPIVAMTANAMEGDRERCFAAGMDDYISKPVEPNQLRTALQKWIRSR